jgi:uncharacterized protein
MEGHEAPIRNSMADVEKFLSDWEGGRHIRRGTFRKLGHMVRKGLAELREIPGDGRGLVFSRHDDCFVDSLEPGVRELVCLLVARLGWVTYSSCEGHCIQHPRKGARRISERAVGLLPRNTQEEDCMRGLLGALVAEMRDRFPGTSAVELGVSRQLLTSRQDGRTYSVMNLFFLRKQDARWEDYFDQLDIVYAEVVDWIKARCCSSEQL